MFIEKSAMLKKTIKILTVCRHSRNLYQNDKFRLSC